MGNKLSSFIRRLKLKIFHFVFDNREVNVITLKCAVSLLRPERYPLINLVANKKAILTPFETCYETRDFFVRLVSILNTPELRVSQLFTETKPLKIPVQYWIRLDQENKDPLEDCLSTIKRSCEELIALLEGKADRTLSKVNFHTLNSELRIITLLIVSLIDLDKA